MNCTCPNPGFCSVLNREMVGRPYQICKGENITPEKREAYLRHWSEAPPKVELPQPKIGTHLKKLLAWLWITDKGCGKCSGLAAKMDKWGVIGVRRHMKEILDNMAEQAKERNIPFTYLGGKLFIELAIHNALGEMK